jgi:hypothetical protein
MMAVLEVLVVLAVLAAAMGRGMVRACPTQQGTKAAT